MLALHAWHLERALGELNRAIALDPGNAGAWHWRSLVLMVAGKSTEALEAIAHARRLDPESLMIRTHAALVLYFAGDLDASMDQYERVLRVAPDFPEALWDSAWVHERKGRYEDAIAILERVNAMAPSPVVLGDIGVNRAMLRETEAARAIANALEDRFAKGTPSSAYAIANVYAVLGDRVRMLEWLDRCQETRDTWFPWALIEPRFDPYRSDAGFQA